MRRRLRDEMIEVGIVVFLAILFTWFFIRVAHADGSRIVSGTQAYELTGNPVEAKVVPAIPVQLAPNVEKVIHGGKIESTASFEDETPKYDFSARIAEQRMIENQHRMKRWPPQGGDEPNLKSERIRT